MNSNLTRAFVLVLAFAGAACGNKSNTNNSSLPALTSSQTTRFSNTLTNLGRVAAVGAKFHSAPQSAYGDATAQPVQTESAKQNEMYQALQAGQQSGQCTIQTQFPTPTNNQGNQDLTYLVTVQGSQCPMSMNLKAHVTSQVTQATAQQAGSADLHERLDLTYNVTDSNLQALNDITATDIHGDIDVALQGGAGVVNETATGNVNGTAQSLTDGTIKITITVNGQGSANQQGSQSQTVTNYRFDYTDMTALLSQTDTMANGQTTSTYTLNGQAISADQAKAYLANLNSLEMSNPQSSSSNTGPISKQ